MEDEIQACSKFPRLGNVSNKNVGSGSGRRKSDGGVVGSDFQTWQERRQEEENSSRIVRVSRGSGGKDRHSKVMTSKGLRDRRVRLSVTTAIQFYDLQDRLGYDQPSKAVDWLIKAASDSISELPSLDKTFARADQSDEKIQEFEFDEGRNRNKNVCLSKSACSSTSETSKENESSIAQQQQHQCHQHHQNMSQTASFTELLTGGIGSSNNGSIHDNQIHHGGFSGHSPFSSENESQLQHFPFLSEQHLMQPSVVNSSSSSSHHHDNYNLNFTISSSGLVGYNRGTLQSNSLLPHFQRFSTMDHGSSTTTSSSNNLPSFFTVPPPAVAVTPTMDQQLHFSPLFDARLQLFYRDGSQHSDQKDKCNKN